MKIYFSASIRSGREKANDYAIIGKFLENYGTILDKHVTDPNLNKNGETLDLNYIFQRDIDWIKESDLLVAEITVPSVGTGYEIAYAENLGKRIICLYDKNADRVSGFIRGNPNIEFISYQDINDCIDKLKEVLDK